MIPPLPRFSRKGFAEALEDVAAHARLVENIKALQEGQKELSDKMRELSDRLNSLQADIRVLKAETKLEAVKETAEIVNAVQGVFHDKLGQLGTKVALLEAEVRHGGLPKDSSDAPGLLGPSGSR